MEVTRDQLAFCFCRLPTELFRPNCTQNSLPLICTKAICKCHHNPIVNNYNLHVSLSLLLLRSNARFLWKRIPATVKQGNVELEKIWTIYNYLWTNDVSNFFKTIAYEWSTNVAELMFELKGNQCHCDVIVRRKRIFVIFILFVVQRKSTKTPSNLSDLRIVQFLKTAFVR